MTIARRILILAGAVPLVLIALGLLNHFELARIESRTRFVVDNQVPSLSALGNISRTFEEMRVALRDHVLAVDAEGRAKARERLDRHRYDLDEFLRHYADSLVSDDQDRRLLDEFRAANNLWAFSAVDVIALSDGGNHEGAAALLGSARVA